MIKDTIKGILFIVVLALTAVICSAVMASIYSVMYYLVPYLDGSL